MDNVESVGATGGFSAGSRGSGVVALCLCLVVGLAACDSGDEQTGEGDRSEADSQKKADEGSSETSAGAVLTGEAPMVPDEAFAAIELGQPMEDVKDKVTVEIPESKTFSLPTSKNYEGVRLRGSLGNESRTINQLKVILEGGPKESAEDDLVASVKDQWGEPDVVYEGALEEKSCWFNPDAGLRACTSNAVGGNYGLAFTEYIPVARFIGEEGDEFAFKKGPILGATLEEIYENYGEHLAAMGDGGDRVDFESVAREGTFGEVVENSPSVGLNYPPTEFQNMRTRVSLFFGDDGSVERYLIRLSFGDDLGEWRQKALDVFEAKFGAPEIVEELGSKSRIYREDPEVTVARSGAGSGDNLVVTVEDGS